MKNKHSRIEQYVGGGGCRHPFDYGCVLPLGWQGLKELEVRPKYGVTIIGIIREGQSMISPHADNKFQEGDHLFALGDHKALAALNKMLAG